MAEIEQHLAWLRLYMVEMKEANWRDMRDQAQQQIDKLEAAIKALKQ